MKMDILAILMVAFALFAILMFILFYIYAKKYRNEKRISESYEEDDIDNDDTLEPVEYKEEIELIDIMINDKDYIFDANNYHLYNSQEVEVLINGNSYHGIVTRSNYKDSLENFTQIPTKLEIKEPEVNDNFEEIKIEETNEDNYDFEEFVPKKKN